MIPIQLQKSKFRFIRLHGKTPIDKGWQHTANHLYWHPEIVMHAHQGRNIGVATGYGDLLVVDFDNAQAQAEALPKLPETFAVKTGGKGLLHVYFFCDDTRSWKVLAADGSTIADVQGRGKQVVSAGSVHESGRHYEIANNISISKIKVEQLRTVFTEYKTTHEKAKSENAPKKAGKTTNAIIKAGLSVPQILQRHGIETNGGNTRCPFHESQSGKCFSYGESWFKCFHCELGGNAADLLLQVIYHG